MAWLPGWNSAESVAKYQTILELTSVTFLLIGTVCAVLLAFYNHRKAEMEVGDKLAMQQQVKIANDTASGANAETKRLHAELEAERRGRLLSPEQLAILTQQLRGVLKPKAGIDLSGIEGDRESMRLAEQLAPVFRDAGFTVDDPYENTVIGGVGKGVAIRQVSKDGATGRGIAEAFSAVGVESHVYEMAVNGFSGVQKVEVIVGRRP